MSAAISPACDNDVTAATTTCVDSAVGWIGILFLIVPIVGFVMYLPWRAEKPEKAKTAGYLALCGFGLSIALQVLSSV